MLALSRIVHRSIPVLLFALSLAACAANRDDLDDGSQSRVSSATAVTGLTEQGFVFVRTDRFSYTVTDPGYDFPGGILCNGQRPPDQICWKTYSHHPGAPPQTYSGQADRYQHPDGRIAYADTTNDKIIGPISPGTYWGSASDPTYTGKTDELRLRVTDLVLGERGSFDLRIEWAVARARSVVRDSTVEGDWRLENYRDMAQGVHVLHAIAPMSFTLGTHLKIGSQDNWQNPPSHWADFVASINWSPSGKNINVFKVAVAQDRSGGIGDEPIVPEFKRVARSQRTCGRPFACTKKSYRCDTSPCTSDYRIDGVYATESACEASCERSYGDSSVACGPSFTCAPGVPVVEDYGPVDPPPNAKQCGGDPRELCNSKTQYCLHSAGQTLCQPMPSKKCESEHTCGCLKSAFFYTCDSCKATDDLLHCTDY